MTRYIVRFHRIEIDGQVNIQYFKFYRSEEGITVDLGYFKTSINNINLIDELEADENDLHTRIFENTEKGHKQFIEHCDKWRERKHSNGYKTETLLKSKM